MVFSTSIFLFFSYFCFSLLTQLTPKILENYTLIIASIGFYTWRNMQFIFVPIIFTIINYYIIKLMYNEKNTKQRKYSLLLRITLNLSLLIIFKYSNLFVLSIYDVLNILDMTAIYWKDIVRIIGLHYIENFQKSYTSKNIAAF